MKKYFKAVKLAISLSLITGVIGIFIFFGSMVFLPIPLISGALIMVFQKGDRIYKYLDKLLVGSIIYGFSASFFTQLFMYLVSNLVYKSGMPFMVFYSPNDYFVFSFIFLFLCFLGGLLGVVLKGFYFIIEKRKKEGGGVSMFVGRGKESMSYFASTFSFFAAMSLALISNKVVLVITILFLLYFCFYNSWFRNKIVGIFSKIKDRKEHNHARDKMIFIFIFLIGIIVLITYFININVKNIGEMDIYSYENIPEAQAALVLGARVWNNGLMSDIFKDRVLSGIKLYEAGKVKKILISGDHGRADYDEVNAAKDFLLLNNVKEEDIFLDHAGFDTYDSIYRARDIFKADSIIIVTNSFHLPRSLYIAEKLDLDASGFSSDIRKYIGEDKREFREKLARVKAFLNIAFKSKPKFLGKEISLEGDGRESWD